MTPNRIRLAPPEDERFKETFFLVEATSFEKFCLWQQWHNEVNWEQDSLGLVGEIGRIDDRPVALSVSWAKIDGQLVAFYEMTSQVTDSQMLEKWLEDNCTPPKWDNGSRRAHCDAQNFHHCIAAVREANARELAAAPRE